MPDKDTAKPMPPGVATGMAVAMMPWSVGAQMAAAWIEGVTRMNGEWARFVAERLKQDAETQHRIFTCGSPVEAQALTADFLRRTIDDYLTETARLSSLGSRVADDIGIRT